MDLRTNSGFPSGNNRISVNKAIVSQYFCYVNRKLTRFLLFLIDILENLAYDGNKQLFYGYKGGFPLNFGNQIRDRRKELGLSRSDVAQALGVSISAIGNYENSINFPSEKVMVRLFDYLQVEPNQLYAHNFQGGDGVMTHNERQMMEKFRPLSPDNKTLVRTLIDTLWQAQQQSTLPSDTPVREIPLYRSPAAAGYVSPMFNTDFEYISVKGLVPPAAEFAVRIQGDSMEPYITDDSVVYVNRDPLRDGDVGIFWVDGDIFCKQYHTDGSGTVYLLSLNRDRCDADIALPAGSERTFTCFGRVMMTPPPVTGM